MHTTAFLPMRLSPSPRPTVVVVLPSPAGVGLIAVTRIRRPSFAERLEAMNLRRDLGLVVAVGQQVLGRDAERLADLPDRPLRRGARDLDVGLHGTLSWRGTERDYSAGSDSSSSSTTSARVTRAAENLNSGILPNGSTAEFVSTLADAST